MLEFFVYILKCSDNSYYTGHTDNLETRIAQHHDGQNIYTRNKRPFILVFSERFTSRNEAFAMERKIKGWTRIKKEALIQKNWSSISIFARKNFKN